MGRLRLRAAGRRVEPHGTAAGRRHALRARRAASGRDLAAVSHGNLIALVLSAHDPAVGFELWDAMPMPALYEIDVDPLKP